MFTPAIIHQLDTLPTPFYYYDVALLQKTLKAANAEAGKHGYVLHYALKANANPTILKHIAAAGFGADCVSGNEVSLAIANGFPAAGVVFAGVGKSDKEISVALDHSIFCFNCESRQEMRVINDIAASKGIVANIAIRINPNIDAHSHHYITTGLEENKFGISPWEFQSVVEKLQHLPNVKLIALHLHLGSQITDMDVFRSLCLRANEYNAWFIDRKFDIRHINVGGGLGIDYKEPDANAIPDFKKYFNVFHFFLHTFPGQQVHFELGRSIVAQCGSLLSRVLYVKQGKNTDFAILDAGMTELIRPALYQAYHKIENLSSQKPAQRYDVVGPICESSDCFGKAVLMNETRRGDLIAIRSAGAYGETMASRYNLRDLPKSYFSDAL